jgi:Striatin family
MRIINTTEVVMDENSINGAQNIGVGQNRTNNNTNDKNDDANGNAQNDVPQYTIPGILHFIEHEWQRFQAERSQWDTDRAELQVRSQGHRLFAKIIYVQQQQKRPFFTAFDREQ